MRSTLRIQYPAFVPVLGFLLACSAQVEDPPIRVASSQATACDPMPYLQAAGITDLNRNPVFSISPNSTYFIRACGKVSSMCMTLSTGATFADSSVTKCADNSFPAPYHFGDIGTAYFRVTTDSSSHITGFVEPWDACVGAQPQFDMNFIVPGSGGCVPTTRHYACGYAMAGFNCNNGRTHALIDATDMTAAIAACHAVQPSGYPDFCYVIDSDGGTSSDTSECTSASGSWRAGNNCCNFKGTLSCP
jgi:hypothetical protein